MPYVLDAQIQLGRCVPAETVGAAVTTTSQNL